MSEKYNEEARAFLMNLGVNEVCDIEPWEVARFVAEMVAKESQWVPVVERLPDVEGWYLVTLDWPAAQKTFVHRVYYWVKKEGRTSGIGWDMGIVVQSPVELIAWRELPAPYTPPTDARTAERAETALREMQEAFPSDDE